MALVFPGYDSGYDAYNPHSMSRRPSMYGGSSYAYDQGGYYNPGYNSMYGQPMSMGGATPMMMGPSAYDDMTVREPYYPDMRRSLSSMSMTRPRRHSAVSSMSHIPLPPPMDAYRRASSINIKFKRKGSLMAGISLAEAQGYARLSNNDYYSLRDLHADRRHTIYLKIRWAGYNSLTYEIPLEASYDDRINLQTLARRISRACVHYLQANRIPIPWDRVDLHHIEEISHGVWQPMLTSR
ncbi:hypothetical protein F5050DRAFT_1805749 [Lentinula boryana]|uniref:DUF6741 domain-containing protein n=1 Tax=Lentinula boryana TaxID=40481 RepID=A0ABQ8QJB7_9AGAR|nr:hypothetical protein F5050DRAFT_1805749 [Lentinula boryana]